jgi:HK97 family phage major capsid protein
MTIQELLTRKGELAEQAKQVLSDAAADGRQTLKPEEETRFDAIHADIDKITATVGRLAKQEAAEKEPESQGRRTEPTPLPARGGEPRRGPLGQLTDWERAEAFRAWALSGSKRATLTDEQRSIAQRCRLDLTASEVELSFFSPYQLRAENMRSVGTDDVKRWQEQTRAALTGAQSTTTTGGYTVADAAMQALEVALLAYGGIRQVARIVRTSTGGPLPFPTTNDTAQKGRLLGENTTTTETEMTFGQLVIDAYKYSSDYILASVEFLQDSSIDVSSFIGEALGTRIARLQSDHFTTGTGSSQPRGIVVGAASGVTGVADPPTYDNFVDLVHSIDPAYRGNSRFMMNDATLKTIKKIKVLQYSGDTTGMPLWAPGLTSAQPDTILGYPFVINQSMASPGSTAKKVLFGDFSKYIIRDVRDVTLLRLDERFAELHQVAFLAFARSDGDLLDAGTNPVKYMSQT